MLWLHHSRYFSIVSLLDLVFVNHLAHSNRFSSSVCVLYIFELLQCCECDFSFFRIWYTQTEQSTRSNNKMFSYSNEVSFVFDFFWLLCVLTKTRRQFFSASMNIKWPCTLLVSKECGCCRRNIKSIVNIDMIEKINMIWANERYNSV